jgi:hypothetical protein
MSTMPSRTAEDIVDLIRRQSWKNGGCHVVDRDDAVALVEQYANAVAAERAIDLTAKTYDSAIALLDSEGSKISAIWITLIFMMTANALSAEVKVLSSSVSTDAV